MKTQVKKAPMARIVVPLSIKAEATNEQDRTFEGFASTWDQDLGQDVIHKGAFKETLTAWRNSKEALPLLDSHNQFSILAALGQMLDGKENNKGLWTKWEVLDGPEGDGVLKRLRPSKANGRSIVGKMSIGFIPEEFSFEQPKGTDSFWDRIRHITKASLKEVSLVLFPMNPMASIDASTVKSFFLSMQNADPRTVDMLTKRELRRVAGMIGTILKKVKDEDGEGDEDDEKKGQRPNLALHKPDGKKPNAQSTKTDLEDIEDDDDLGDLDLEEDDEEEGTGDEGETEVDEIDDEDEDDEEEGEGTDDEGDEEQPDDKKSTGKSGEHKKSEKDKKSTTPPAYQFGEALEQRLSRLRLGMRTEDIKDKQ